MPTPEEERKARAWLAEASNGRGRPDDEDNRHKATLLALLDRPVLPAEPTEEMLQVIGSVGCPSRQWIQAMWRVLYAHLTKPKTQKAWRVKGSSEHFATPQEAFAYGLQCVSIDKTITIEECEVPA